MRTRPLGPERALLSGALGACKNYARASFVDILAVRTVRGNDISYLTKENKHFRFSKFCLVFVCSIQNGFHARGAGGSSVTLRLLFPASSVQTPS